MKKLSRSITLGVALSLIVLIALTGSAAAAKPEPYFHAGQVGYTWNSTSTQAKLDSSKLNWGVYRPDTACISVWSSDGSSLIVRACGSAIKGSDEKPPQNMDLAVMINNSLLTGGATYKVQVDLMRHSKIIASAGFNTITAVTSSVISSTAP